MEEIFMSDNQHKINNSKFHTDAKSFYSLETSVKKPIDISKMTGQQNNQSQKNKK